MSLRHASSVDWDGGQSPSRRTRKRPLTTGGPPTVTRRESYHKTYGSRLPVSGQDAPRVTKYEREREQREQKRKAA